MIQKIRMKRHESFSIREGWLAKGLTSIKKDNKIFSSPSATDELGVGYNMVKSLKYWMHATKLIQNNSNEIELSEFGELVLKYDRYLEDKFTWWLIHLQLTLNIEDAFVINCFYNKLLSKKFTKQELYETIVRVLTTYKIEFNEKTLLDEINMVIKTYVADDNDDNPENNFNCPLSDLELIKKVNRDTYEKNRPAYKSLNYLIVYYLIKQLIEGKEYISIDDLMKLENGPSKILNLDKNLINDYLDEMKKNELIIINRTAGLNMVYLRRKLNLKDIFEEYFSRRQL